VSIEFCQGYRADMLQWIHHGHMSVKLDREISSLERVPITEAAAEPIHAGVSRTYRAGPASMLPWVASTARLSQNIRLVEVRFRSHCSIARPAPWTVDLPRSPGPAPHSDVHEKSAPRANPTPQGPK